MLANQLHQSGVGYLPIISNNHPEYTEVERAWMVIDLVDSTSWYLARDDMTSFALLRICIQQMSNAVEEYQGHVIRLSGDGLHSSFENPADALHCAIAYQCSMISVDDQSTFSFPSARIGLSLGVCARCEVRGLVDYHGSAVILATRLAQCRDCDGVLMSEAFRSAPDVAEILESVHVDVRLRALKGFPAPLKVYHLDNDNLCAIRGDSAVRNIGEAK